MAGSRSARSTFAAGGAQSIHLADNTGEPVADSAQLVFDAVRLTRIDGGSPPEGGPRTAVAGCTAGRGAGLLVLAMWLGVRKRRRR